MEKAYFEFRGWDYFPVLGIIRASGRFEDAKIINPNIKIKFNEGLFYVCAQATEILTLSIIPSALELLVK
ncbi:MAG: hypothetical protein NTW17_00440 [Candidatus Pacearchaeota archaeon]|nr:hypothetical protein [Candidatus Pacearchaeota archaeon]